MPRFGHILLSATVVAGGCGSGDEVTVTDAWARASAPTQTVGAVYFDLTVAEDDTLVAASVPASVAARAEIHEVVMDGDPADETDHAAGSHDMDETDTGSGSVSYDGGRMRMQERADGFALTGGEVVSFEPGGYHVMLPELTGPLEVGEQFPLTLEFADADDVTVTVEVAESAP